MRKTYLALLLFAACSGGGGIAQELTLVVDNLVGPVVVVGEPLVIRVILMRGNVVATDYRGTLTFTASAEAELPWPYVMAAADAGARSFPSGIVFTEEGPCTLTISAEGVSVDVSIAIEVAPEGSPPTEEPEKPTGPGGVPQIGTLVPIETGIAADGAISVAIGDFDGDGVPDVIVGTKANSKNLMFLNLGDASFGDAIEVSNDTMARLIAVDFSGDGVADLAYLDKLLGQVFVRLNNGSGGFGPPKVIASKANDIAIGDIDGDGDIDIVAGGLELQSLMNDGAGKFSDGGKMTVTGWGDVTSLVLADVNNDKSLDAVTQYRLYLNKGKGTFADSTFPLGGLGQMGYVAAADMNGDGSVDAVVGMVTVHRPSLSVLLNNGVGWLAHTGQELQAGEVLSSLLTLDVDFDGDPDVITGVAGNYASLIWRNDGAGKLTASDFVDGPESVYRMAKGDLDGDGDADVVTVGYLGAVQVYRHTYVSDR